MNNTQIPRPVSHNSAPWRLDWQRDWTGNKGPKLDSRHWNLKFFITRVTRPTWCPTDNYSFLPASYIQLSLKLPVMLRLHTSMVKYIIVADLSNIPIGYLFLEHLVTDT
jgi:hypothetical protein